MSERESAVGRLGYFVFNAEDKKAAADFWGAVLGVETGEESPPYIDLKPLRTPAPTLSFQCTPPESAGVIHPDIIVEDLGVATGRVLELGAVLVRECNEKGFIWNTFQDPNGLPFCLVTE